MTRKALPLAGLAAVLWIVGFAATAEAAQGRVSRALGLHEGPGNQYRTILTVPDNSIINYSNCVYGFCYTVWGGYAGYVSQQYIAPYAPPPVYYPYAPPPPPPPPTYYRY